MFRVNKLEGDPVASIFLRLLKGRNSMGGQRYGDRNPGVRRFFKRMANKKLRQSPIEWEVA